MTASIDPRVLITMKPIEAWTAVTGRTFTGLDQPERIQAIREGEDIIRQARIAYNPVDDAQVGDGITLRGYTECYAYTVIRRTAKTITLQRDIATLINGDELEFIPGGFAAHCTNQRIQKYEYTPNPDGGVVTIRRNKKGNWVRPGETGKGAFMGRREFYDYNF